MKSLSLKAGLSESAVRDAITRGRSPSVDNFVRLAEALGVSPVWLLQGDERFRLRVPLVGVASGHETWTAKGGDKSADFDLDLASADVICIRIEGRQAVACLDRALSFEVASRSVELWRIVSTQATAPAAPFDAVAVNDCELLGAGEISRRKRRRYRVL